MVNPVTEILERGGCVGASSKRMGILRDVGTGDSPRDRDYKQIVDSLQDLISKYGLGPVVDYGQLILWDGTSPIQFGVDPAMDPGFSADEDIDTDLFYNVWAVDTESGREHGVSYKLDLNSAIARLRDLIQQFAM